MTVVNIAYKQYACEAGNDVHINAIKFELSTMLISKPLRKNNNKDLSII